ncbi:hypothetical protein [Ideonella sp. A 288]|uniref:hypothetical protein n=1 Tax=Ideonella sp. A 288 TaxID=1962181 RepID=UPI001185CB8B|nr:hypothetical protein [Ideonella sp. A 288]
MNNVLTVSPGQAFVETTGQEGRSSVVQTSIWITEHDLLYRLLKSPVNTVPRFRYPDLLGACIALALRDADSQRPVIEFLITQLTLRDPSMARRSCEIWPTEFELLLSAHRAPWNRFPNPMFMLDDIATACVALAMARPDGHALVVSQARINLRERTMSHPTAEG